MSGSITAVDLIDEGARDNYSNLISIFGRSLPKSGLIYNIPGEGEEEEDMSLHEKYA